jgi:hypothetical protein
MNTLIVQTQSESDSESAHLNAKLEELKKNFITQLCIDIDGGMNLKNTHNDNKVATFVFACDNLEEQFQPRFCPECGNYSSKYQYSIMPHNILCNDPNHILKTDKLILSTLISQSEKSIDHWINKIITNTDEYSIKSYYDCIKHLQNDIINQKIALQTLG